jgi:hypothetical protein
MDRRKSRRELASTRLVRSLRDNLTKRLPRLRNWRQRLLIKKEELLLKPFLERNLKCLKQLLMLKPPLLPELTTLMLLESSLMRPNRPSLSKTS